MLGKLLKNPVTWAVLAQVGLMAAEIPAVGGQYLLLHSIVILALLLRAGSVLILACIWAGYSVFECFRKFNEWFFVTRDVVYMALTALWIISALLFLWKLFFIFRELLSKKNIGREIGLNLICVTLFLAATFAVFIAESLKSPVYENTSKHSLRHRLGDVSNQWYLHLLGGKASEPFSPEMSTPWGLGSRTDARVFCQGGNAPCCQQTWKEKLPAPSKQIKFEVEFEARNCSDPSGDPQSWTVTASPTVKISPWQVSISGDASANERKCSDSGVMRGACNALPNELQ